MLYLSDDWVEPVSPKCANGDGLSDYATALVVHCFIVTSDTTTAWTT